MFSIKLARLPNAYAFGDIASIMRLTATDKLASVNDESDALSAFASTRRLGNRFMSARRTIMAAICRRLEAQHAAEYWVTGISDAWPLDLGWELATTILTVPDMVRDIRGLEPTSLTFPELDGMPTILMTPDEVTQNDNGVPRYRITWVKHMSTEGDGMSMSHQAYGDEVLIKADALEVMLLDLLRNFTALVDTCCAIAKAHPVYTAWEEEVHDLLMDHHDWMGLSELLANTVSILPHDA